MNSLERSGQFGEYEVWESTDSTGRDWHITDRKGDFIYPGDDDLLKARALISNRNTTAPRSTGTSVPAQLAAVDLADAERLIDAAVKLRQFGEDPHIPIATWRGWDSQAEAFLRRNDPEETSTDE